MPQLRKDPVTGRWVIVNVENPKKADAFPTEVRSHSTRACPFCPGNESITPPEIMALGRKEGTKNLSNWLVRVFANKFPALRIEESTDHLGIGIYDKVGGFGAHEVIVENPDHEKHLADLPLKHVELVLRAYQERFVDLRKDARFKYILIFKNYGASAGASQEHPHSQLIALPIVPSRVLDELKGSLKYYEATDRCIYCDMLNQERFEKQLTIFENSEFAAIAPFASRFPFETWILPRVHEPHFDSTPGAKLEPLAEVVKTTLLKIKAALRDPSFNFMIHTIPVHSKQTDSYHWHIEIIPHLTHVAGFELGTGFYVNPIPPEIAAQTLKNTV